MRVPLGSSLWGLESQFCSGLVCLLGEVLEFCDRSSGETASELFDFCDNTSWDAAAEYSLQGVTCCKRSSNGSWRDGGEILLF